MKKNLKKTQKKAQESKSFGYYQVISQNNKFNFGAFPGSKEGLSMAKEWAAKMSEETGEKCVVKKR